MVHVKSLESETGSRLRGLVLKICVGYANFLVEFRIHAYLRCGGIRYPKRGYLYGL